MGGGVISAVPFHLSASAIRVAPSVKGTIPCRPPVRSAFEHRPKDGGWFGYAPNTSIVYAPGYCADEARRRLGAALSLVLAGAGLLVFDRRRVGDNRQA
jgi:predicted RNase H-like HicB family nuclease